MLINDCERHQLNNAGASDSSGLITRVDTMLSVVEEGIQLLCMSVHETEHSLLLGIRRDLSRHLRLLLYGFNDCTVPPIAISTYSLQYSGAAGRPRIIVNIDTVEFLRSCGYTWNQVAHALQVSRSTLWRRLKEADYEIKKYTDISDDELDSIVAQIQRGNPNCGLQLMYGYLRDRGVHVQRYRLRESVVRIDPLKRMVRWQQVVSRRTYSVKRSNSLWHIDGHHSLIRWRMVIHGAIDGYSRMIVYLACSTNNRSLTVYKLFKAATDEFGVPSRVRSDKGGENVLVCQFMIRVRGTGRASHIAGSSVHNQRIERLWRDVYRCVCSTYHELFYSMEAMGVLDPVSDTDLFVLHCVYLPRINRSFDEFARAWNFHPIRTERNWSPRQIMINSLIREADIASSDIPAEDFGVNPEGPVAEEDVGTVQIPETDPPLDEDELQFFLDHVDIVSSFVDFGVQHYINCKQLFQSML